MPNDLDRERPKSLEDLLNLPGYWLWIILTAIVLYFAWARK